MPVISNVPGASCFQLPPRAVRQRRVASTSLENEMFATVLVPAARAAAISRRWVWDLLGGGVTVPEREWGMI